MERLRATGITKKYGDRTIIENVDITLNDREIVCLLGLSGVGKTTLFHCLSGLVMPDGGEVRLYGEDITGTPGKISYMLQKDLLLPFRKMVDNVAMPLLLKKVPKKEARKRASELFPRFGLDGCEDKYPHQLSGGMCQRAALLRTYLSSSGVALLDEPFSALDSLTKSDIHGWYLDIMEEIDLSTVFITHDIDEAILLSDRVYILAGSPGKISDEIVIDVHKPRSKDFNLTSEFIEYKRRIIESLSAI